MELGSHAAKAAGVSPRGWNPAGFWRKAFLGWALVVAIESRLSGSIRPYLQCLGILILGAMLGLGINAVSSRGIPLWPPKVRANSVGTPISVTQAYQQWKLGTAVFLDAREPADYAAGHIANALNLPAQSFSSHFGAIAPMLTPASELIVYCDGIECELSHRVAGELRRLGYTNLQLVLNGWSQWSSSGFPRSSEEVQ